MEYNLALEIHQFDVINVAELFFQAYVFKAFKIFGFSMRVEIIYSLCEKIHVLEI